MEKLLLSAVFALAHLTAFAQNDAPATVVDLVSSNEDLSTLAEALGAAGLLETLSGEGPFTVFAPTNEAFEALDGAASASQALLEPGRILVAAFSLKRAPLCSAAAGVQLIVCIRPSLA